jgi:hypothetical protein
MMRSVPKSKNCQHWILIDYYNRQRCSVENKKSGVIITIKTVVMLSIFDFEIANLWVGTPNNCYA